jgi:hypothetical protein
MRAKTILVLFALTFATSLVPASRAGVQQTDPSIQTFWAKFKLAVTKGDKESIAAMSQFPIEMPYGFPKIKTKAQLIKRYRDLFTVQANAVKCFAKATPVLDEQKKNQFSIGCKDHGGMDNVQYGFAKKGGVWKLIFLDNIAE